MQRKREVGDKVPKDMNLGSDFHLNFHFSVNFLTSISNHVTILLEQGFGSRINDQ